VKYELPQRIRVTNETGKSSDTAIYDADTGKTLTGVLEVKIDRHGITITATAFEPIEAAMSLPDWDGLEFGGVAAQERTYPIKRLELESW
jgi:hypothetical protein